MAEQAEDAVNTDYRTCEFCGCHTNAALRRCCEKGTAADKKKPSDIDRIAGELIRDLLATEADRPRIRAALIEYGDIVREECAKKDRRLKKPARVGATVFRVGVNESLVIDRAQREYEYAKESATHQENIEGIRNLIADAIRNK